MYNVLFKLKFINPQFHQQPVEEKSAVLHVVHKCFFQLLVLLLPEYFSVTPPLPCKPKSRLAPRLSGDVHDDWVLNRLFEFLPRVISVFVGIEVLVDPTFEREAENGVLWREEANAVISDRVDCCLVLLVCVFIVKDEKVLQLLLQVVLSHLFQIHQKNTRAYVSVIWMSKYFEPPIILNTKEIQIVHVDYKDW